MFTAALPTTAKSRSNPNVHTPIDGWMDTGDVARAHTHTHIHRNITQPQKKNGTRPFAATWMDPETIILWKQIRKRKTNTRWRHLYVESKIRHNEPVYKTETPHRHRREACQSRLFILNTHCISRSQAQWLSLIFPFPCLFLPHPSATFLTCFYLTGNLQDIHASPERVKYGVKGVNASSCHHEQSTMPRWSYRWVLQILRSRSFLYYISCSRKKERKRKATQLTFW